MENDRRWRMGSRWRMVGAGKWQSLGDGRRWRMAGAEEMVAARIAVAGEWQSLENGSRWRMVGAGEMLSPEKSGR
jgi:hypothetical protein